MTKFNAVQTKVSAGNYVIRVNGSTFNVQKVNSHKWAIFSTNADNRTNKEELHTTRTLTAAVTWCEEHIADAYMMGLTEIVETPEESNDETGNDETATAHSEAIDLQDQFRVYDLTVPMVELSPLQPIDLRVTFAQWGDNVNKWAHETTAKIPTGETATALYKLIGGALLLTVGLPLTLWAIVQMFAFVLFVGGFVGGCLLSSVAVVGGAAKVAVILWGAICGTEVLIARSNRLLCATGSMLYNAVTM